MYDFPALSIQGELSAFLRLATITMIDRERDWSLN
jgi:hypothetical protein